MGRLGVQEHTGAELHAVLASNEDVDTLLDPYFDLTESVLPIAQAWGEFVEEQSTGPTTARLPQELRAGFYDSVRLQLLCEREQRLVAACERCQGAVGSVLYHCPGCGEHCT